MPASSFESSSPSTRGTRPGGIFDVVIVDDRPGLVVLEISGEDSAKAFQHEPGGHRVQRVPPTEKRGRVHSSSVTVAVLPVPSERDVVLLDRDLTWKVCRGSGPGGQSVNTTDSAVQLTHEPSGISVRCQNERSQQQNRRSALALLRSKLVEAQDVAAGSARSRDRRSQLGTGMRGDKVRTIAFQRGEVVDHRLGTRMRIKEYVEGKIEVLLTTSSA